MNARERELATLLNEMRRDFGVVAVKAEFEAEGTRLRELMRLKEIASKIGMNVALKIGGPEDVWGILQARDVGVSDIVAPMVESAYGLKKFLGVFNKYIPEDEREECKAAINVETVQAYNDLDNILKVGKELGLHCVTIGRVDLTGSLGWGRDKIDSLDTYAIVESICARAKKAGFRVTMGGGVESGSWSFIGSLVAVGVLDRFETRKIIFDVSSKLMVEPVRYEAAIKSAHLFDLKWLENKRAFYSSIAEEDAHRIPLLQKRIQ